MTKNKALLIEIAVQANFIEERIKLAETTLKEEQCIEKRVDYESVDFELIVPMRIMIQRIKKLIKEARELNNEENGELNGTK